MNDLITLINQWRSLPPLTPAQDQKLWRELRLQWNYHSNHIEGNTLTYGETELLLIQGRTMGLHEMREYEEMKGHDVAILHLRELAAAPEPITEADVRNLNRVLLKEPFWKPAITPDGHDTRIQISPGEYKTHPNNVRTVTGEIFHYASPQETPLLMGQLMMDFRRELEEATDETLLPCLARMHHRFSLIHPFDDGNGRVMRLLVNYGLLRKGLPPLIIPTEEKQTYLRSLSAADAGDLTPFTSYLQDRTSAAIQTALQLIQA